MNTFKVGLLHFRETFGKDLHFHLSQAGKIKDCNGEEIQLKIEHVPIREIGLNLEKEYDLILDRASHYFKQGIAYSMMQAYQGARIVNNPMSFHYFIDRKDVGFYMAHQLGIKVPETYLLPCCKTPHFKEQDFIYHKHFDWDKIIKDIGFPSILKPANGRGAINVNQCNNKMELMFYYQKSGTELMTLQKKVDSPYDWQVRCICLGKHILPCQYVFRKNDQAEYIDKEDFLPKETLRKVIDSTQIINRAFGYEMNSVEFIIDRDGEPWAIDFNNPVPDGRLSALGEFWYKKYQDAMVNMIIDAAKESQNQPFLPEINQYADIARSNKTPTQKHRAALKIAKKYYNS